MPPNLFNQTPESGKLFKAQYGLFPVITHLRGLLRDYIVLTKLIIFSATTFTQFSSELS